MKPIFRTITTPILAAALAAVLAPHAVAQAPQAFQPFQNQAQQQQAQQQGPALSLFEDVEQPSSPAPVQPVGPRPNASANGPQFSLVGTSRFGDRYRVSVRDSSGEVIRVDAAPGGSAAIPGHPGFRITDIGARHAMIQHPASSPCFDFADQGVSCEGGGNTARLALVTAQAIQPEPEPQPRRRGRAETQEMDAAAAAEQGAENRPENPFAAALRAARERGESPEAAASRAEAQRFRARRIDPSEVPEGYQLIRTPFGDRVVPQ